MSLGLSTVEQPHSKPRTRVLLRRLCQMQPGQRELDGTCIETTFKTSPLLLTLTMVRPPVDCLLTQSGTIDGHKTLQDRAMDKLDLEPGGHHDPVEEYSDPMARPNHQHR